MGDSASWTGIRQHPKRSGSSVGSARLPAERRSGASLFVIVVLLVIFVTFATQVLVGAGGWGRFGAPLAGTPGAIRATHLVSMNVGAPPGYGLTNARALQAHAPIHIDGNTSFTAANGVRSGTGTKSDPYIISDWFIDMTNYPTSVAGVWIQHASKYVIVRNIEITNLVGSGTFFGVLLGTNSYPPVTTDWAENISVTHVLVHNMPGGYGIQSAYYTKNNNLSFNAVFMNITSRDWQYGITCQGGSQNCVIWGNYVDARNAQPGPTYTLKTVGIQAGDGCTVSFGIQILPCATVTVAYNTVTNATAEGFVADGTTRSSFFNNLAYQNYPGRKQISGYTSRGIMVESRSNYSKVHDNVFYQFDTGIEVGAWGGSYWNNTVHDNDWGLSVDTNSSFGNVAFTLFNTIWNTTYYGNAIGNVNIPAGQYTVFLDGQSDVTSTNFPFQLVNQGGQSISGVRYLWTGTDVIVSYDLTAWGYMRAVTIFDHQVSSYSQSLSAVWSGSRLGVAVSQFTPSGIAYTISSGTGATIRASGLTATAYYGVYRAGNLLATLPTDVAGGLSFGMPVPASGSYEIRFASPVPVPTISLSSPVNGSYVTSSSVQASWLCTDPGPGLQSVLLSVDGGTPVNVSAQGTDALSGLADGRHVITVTAIDVTGLSAEASVSIVVDTHPPVVTIHAPVNGANVNATTILLSWNATDATSGIKGVNISLDSGPAIATTGNNYTLVGLSQGSHRVSVTAVDHAGLSATATTAFTVAATSPSPPGNATNPGTNATRTAGPAVRSVAYLPNASAVDIAFTQPMNQTSVAKSINVSSGVDYSLQWVNQSHVRIILHTSLSNGSLYQVVLQPSAKTATGTSLQTPFVFQFVATGMGNPVAVATTAWLPILIFVITLLLIVNWATAGYLIVHYRQNAKRVKSRLNRFAKRYAGSMTIVYKKLALGSRPTRKAGRTAVPKKTPVRKPVPKGPVTKVRKVVRKTAGPATPRWKPPGGHR